MLVFTGKNNRKNNYNNGYNLNGIKITTENNEILTYDKKNKISFGIPEGFVSNVALSDSNKSIKKENSNITITTIADMNSAQYYKELQQRIKESYLDDEMYKDVELANRKTITLGDRIFNYVDFSCMVGSLKNSERYIWTDILENNILELKIKNPEHISEEELMEILTISIEEQT